MAISEKDSLILSNDQYNLIAKCLSNLHFEIGAQCILLADSFGNLMVKVGLVGDLDVTNLISLLAGGFATTFEMSKYLREKEAFNLNYHEGSFYDVYSANVGEKLFLTLIFDRRLQTSRIGMVWLYTKRSIRELVNIIATTNGVKTKQVLDSEFSASLSDKLDNLFD
jgi:hypothetical protein